MRRIVLVMLILLPPAVLLADDYFQVIPMAEVVRLKGRPDVYVFDVNVDEVWVEHSVPGSVHVNIDNLAAALPKDRKSTLIFYCEGPESRRAAEAANASVLFGFRKVYVMVDGIFLWMKLGYPVQ